VRFRTVLLAVARELTAMPPLKPVVAVADDAIGTRT
jgi:hypothetical protein